MDAHNETDYLKWREKSYAILKLSKKFNNPVHPRFTKPEWWEVQMKKVYEEMKGG